jgi:hypothetical protein
MDETAECETAYHPQQPENQEYDEDRPEHIRLLLGGWSVPNYSHACDCHREPPPDLTISFAGWSVKLWTNARTVSSSTVHPRATPKRVMKSPKAIITIIGLPPGHPRRTHYAVT